MKKIVFLIGLLFLLVGCLPGEVPDEIVQQPDDENDDGEVSIVPSDKLSEKNYKMVLPLRPSEARGIIVDQVSNRLDIHEMEDGLRRHSTDVFDPDKYYFEEGQYLSGNTVKTWIDDLNPDRPEKNADKEEYKDNPRFFSHLLEQNFVDNDSKELAGVSLGIAIKSVYQYETDEGGPYFEPIPKKEMLEKGKETAQTILERVRNIEELQNVPIMIALYREEEAASPVPGNYITKTVVDSSDMLINEDDWEDIDEEYVLFPSSQGKDEHPESHEALKSFGDSISDYFPNYVGYIGEGFYINNDMQKLSIEVPIEFNGSSEVIGFTQYTYGIVKEKFENHYDLEVKIMSSDKIESIIYQEAGEEEPTVHILH